MVRIKSFGCEHLNLTLIMKFLLISSLYFLFKEQNLMTKIHIWNIDNRGLTRSKDIDFVINIILS